MRKGWDEKNLNAPKLAKIAEDQGFQMITIHGRTRSQMFKGKSDWDFIKNVKKKVKIPVVVNGDINSFKDFKDANIWDEVKKYQPNFMQIVPSILMVMINTPYKNFKKFY